MDHRGRPAAPRSIFEPAVAVNLPQILLQLAITLKTIHCTNTNNAHNTLDRLAENGLIANTMNCHRCQGSAMWWPLGCLQAEGVGLWELVAVVSVLLLWGLTDSGPDQIGKYVSGYPQRQFLIYLGSVVDKYLLCRT